MVSPKPRRATYEDVLNAPPHMVAEIIGGELRLSPRPAIPHTIVASALGEELGPPFKRGRGGPGGWIILDEPELHLGDEILVPDLAGWRRERFPEHREGAFVEVVPDWVCKILSPSTEKSDRAEKLGIYAEHGVRHAWLLHPVHRSLEVLRLHEDKWLRLAMHPDDQQVRAEPFDAIALDLSVLWADLAP